MFQKFYSLSGGANRNNKFNEIRTKTEMCSPFISDKGVARKTT